MRGKRLSIRMRAVLAIFAAALFVASTGAAAQEKVLHSFNSDGTDGVSPDAGLIFDGVGNLYGTTYGGPLPSGGTVFELTPAAGGGWTEKVLHNFTNSTDGVNPVAGLIFDGAGNLYGTTVWGGTYGWGTVFELTPAAGGGWTEQLLHNFSGPDGVAPQSALVIDAAGNLYGTTSQGGTYAKGTVFELMPSAGGDWTEKVLYSFSNDGTDGTHPVAGLLFDGAGNLYSTTYGGGTYNKGTVFELTPAAGGGWTERVLYSFGNGTDGINPCASLIFDGAGNLYSTTQSGGTYNGGTVFELTPAAGGSWTEQVLHNFNNNGTDGINPKNGLIFDATGNLYGTTNFGGIYYSGGTVFEVVPAAGGGWTEQVLHSFGDGADGAEPQAGLITDTTGNLYGTTSSGGTYTFGTVFEFTPAPVAEQFVPLSQPCRAVDTRPANGGNGPIPGGTFQNFAISGAGTCGTLTSAAAYSMNVSVIPNGPLGYLTVWPAGQPRPLASTLNSLDGRIKANAAIIPAGTNGQISVYALNTTNVIVDINGYFAPVSGSTLAFYPLTPCRVADTRKSNFPQGLGPPFLTSGQERAFPILNATTCNIPPTGVAAYSLNFSVVPHGSLFYMTVWPTGQTRPVVSTLNDIPGQIIANAAIVVAGTGGNVSVYPTNDTDLVIDINGYFATAGPGGLSLYGVQPCRVIDTRKVGAGNPFSGTLSPPVDVVDAGCAASSLAQAYVFNASVVPVGALGYLTLWPDGATQPLVSTLNALDGSISSNMAIVPSTNGKVDAYASGITQLVLDISSYFAP